MCINFSLSFNNDDNFSLNFEEESFHKNLFSDEEPNNDISPMPSLFYNFKPEIPINFMNLQIENKHTAPQSNEQNEIFLNDKIKDDNNLSEFNSIFILDEKKQDENTFISEKQIEIQKQKGRPKQNSSYKGIHTNKSADNGSNKILRYFIKSLHDEIQEEIIEYFKDKKKKILKKIHVPTIKEHLNKGASEKLSFFNMKTFSVFTDMAPKRVKQEIKKNRNMYSYNRDVLTNILKYEYDDINRTKKELNIRLNSELNVFLKSFLSDEKKLNINGKEITLNDKFKTIKNYYEENKSIYTEDDIINFKEYIYKIMDGKIQFRAKHKKSSEK